MKNRAIIIDLDGTVVNSPLQKKPSKELVTATEVLSDLYYVCAATGRAWSFAKNILKHLRLKDPCIIAGGTTICDPVSGEILWQKIIKRKALENVIDIMREYPKYKIIFNDYTEQDYLHGGILPAKFKFPGEVYFLEQIFIPDEVAIELTRKLSVINGVTCTMVLAQRKGFRDLHITNDQATKEHSIEILLSMLRVNKQNTIGIGDGHNDLHLFASVNYKVAMGNAVSELKLAADEIIGNVKNDGLVDYFKSLLLKE